MDIKPIILAMAAATSSVAVAQINSPQSIGYLQRASVMLGDGNFQGCLDQCQVALKLGDANREQLEWLSAVAAFRGGMPEAESRLKAFVRQYPASARIPSSRLMLATLRFYGHHYAEALKQFRAISRGSLRDDEAETLDYQTAFCLMKLGKDGEAKELMQKLAGTSRYGAAADFYLGYIAYAEDDFAAALKQFDLCDKNSAPGDMADYYIGQIYFRQGRYADAINVMLPMLARKNMPEEFHDEAERVVGECLYELGDDNRAMAYLNPYIEKHLATAPLSTRYIVGVERYQTGQYDQAIALLAPVTELSDEMGQSAALTIGQSYLALGNTKSALMAFDKAAHMGVSPRLTEMAYYNYAVAQIDGGRIPFGNSVKTLEEFISRYPDSRYANTVREYLVKGYMATDDYEGALRWLNSYQGKPTDDVLNARQQVNFILGTRATDNDKAIAYLLEAQKYASRNAALARQTQLWLGDAYYAKGDYKKAESQYQAFLKTAPSADPNRAIAQYNLAYALFGQRRYSDARNQFHSAEKSRNLPADAKVDCMNRIADTYYYAKDFSTAEQAYQQAYDSNPGIGDYSLYQMGVMQGHRGKREQKLATMERMISEFPSSSLRPGALVEKAMTQLAMGDSQAAIQTYGQVVDQYPATVQGRNALLQLAILNANSGNTDKAIEFYKTVIVRHPSSAEATLAVQDLKRIYGEDGRIDELNSFLEQTEGAPQLDAMERNAIAAASLLKKARTGKDDTERLRAALDLLDKYPDADGAEDALMIAATIEFNQGLTDRALEHFAQLEQRASTPSMRHSARMGILRSARDMGDNDRIIAISDAILASSTGSGSDLPEVKFIRAGAFADKGDTQSAINLWESLAGNPAGIFGTRSAFELADLHYRNGNLDRAAETAEALIDANPPHAYWLARTFILYSDIRRAQGAEYEADEYLRVLRTNYPGSETDIFIMIDKRLPQQQ